MASDKLHLPSVLCLRVVRAAKKCDPVLYLVLCLFSSSYNLPGAHPGKQRLLSWVFWISHSQRVGSFPNMFEIDCTVSLSAL